MNPLIKALALIAMGLFLYSRFFGGTLLFYINERFVWLTIFCAIGLIVVGASYRYQHTHGGHSHGEISWGGLLLVLSPILLGLIVPPQPLGAAAMSNRDVSVDKLTSAASGPENSQVLIKPQEERTILDWLVQFWGTSEMSAFDGKEATVIGFVYRDDRFSENRFMVSRFVVSCCAADAAPLGLITEWEDSDALPLDTWVEVTGTFQAGQFDGKEMPILHADIVMLTETPARPYLYPY